MHMSILAYFCCELLLAKLSLQATLAYVRSGPNQGAVLHRRTDGTASLSFQWTTHGSALEGFV